VRICNLLAVAFVPLFLISCDSGSDDDSAPAPPLVLTLVRDGAGALLTWTDTLAEDGFKVWRDADDSGVPTQIATPNAEVGTYLDSGLANGVKYTYYVEAMSGGTVIGTSASVTAEYIKVLTPNGGVTYGLGDTVPITWETNIVGTAWVIKALYGSSDVAQVHESGALSGFAWLAGYGSDGTSANATAFITVDDPNVTIRVHYYQALAHQTDDSDAPFTITNP
jgi:hypothetical protein